MTHSTIYIPVPTMSDDTSEHRHKHPTILPVRARMSAKIATATRNSSIKFRSRSRPGTHPTGLPISQQKTDSKECNTAMRCIKTP